MANFLDNIRDYFSRPTRSQLQTLARRRRLQKGGADFGNAPAAVRLATLTKGHCRLASR
ncbi:hypothetical protein [Duncaniella freteri]|uniref:hypothetical protein n=1 Tax=Duncaniella freteri TaxID=2530391 RepID=UPI0014823E8F|nr:hypothetical protein [Duncaniella freteri]